MWTDAYHGYAAGFGMYTHFAIGLKLHIPIGSSYKLQTSVSFFKIPPSQLHVEPVLTHLPFKVKCRRQVDSSLYKSNLSAWRMIYAKEGLRGVFFGWSPTFIGYSMQGAGKYGFYEGFKYLYGDKLAPNLPKQVVFLAASASAEFLADIALCPMEAIKVRMQTTLPPFAHNLRDGWSKVIAQEGVAGLYKGLYPLWARQIPYTMVKFATFEETVSRIYSFLGKPKDSYNSLQQTGVSFLGGYIAGIFCAVVSHPAGTSKNLCGLGNGWLMYVNRCHGVKTQQ